EIVAGTCFRPHRQTQTWPKTSARNYFPASAPCNGQETCAGQNLYCWPFLQTSPESQDACVGPRLPSSDIRLGSPVFLQDSLDRCDRRHGYNKYDHSFYPGISTGGK